MNTWLATRYEAIVRLPEGEALRLIAVQADHGAWRWKVRRILIGEASAVDGIEPTLEEAQAAAEQTAADPRWRP